jgi:hypothetical protein
LEKITVQESSENTSNTAMTAIGIGSELLTISQKLTCATMLVQLPEINPNPFFTRPALIVIETGLQNRKYEKCLCGAY